MLKYSQRFDIIYYLVKFILFYIFFYHFSYSWRELKYRQKSVHTLSMCTKKKTTCMYVYKKNPLVDLTFPGSDMCEINTSPPATWRIFVPPLTMTSLPGIIGTDKSVCRSIKEKIRAYVSPPWVSVANRNKWCFVIL